MSNGRPSCRAQSNTLAHGLLLNAVIVIMVLLALLLVDVWAGASARHDRSSTAARSKPCAASRASACACSRAVVILLILIGVPTQFGTMIGIVGAGLTVALKDFIVAFFGWLVLMGRNGIRLGDWVEINGVSGEVTELGMFHTVLLETGNWSDAGHPTGRRVTFTNSFAIEGHYFNFSTSGQWLWDELQVVVPAGRDPYPIVDAITKQVAEATAESARQAEQEWQRAVPAQRGKAFSGDAGRQRQTRRGRRGNRRPLHHARQRAISCCAPSCTRPPWIFSEMQRSHRRGNMRALPT